MDSRFCGNDNGLTLPMLKRKIVQTTCQLPDYTDRTDLTHLHTRI
jgi:hypothetical protein